MSKVKASVVTDVTADEIETAAANAAIEIASTEPEEIQRDYITDQDLLKSLGLKLDTVFPKVTRGNGGFTFWQGLSKAVFEHVQGMKYYTIWSKKGTQPRINFFVPQKGELVFKGIVIPNGKLIIANSQEQLARFCFGELSRATKESIAANGGTQRATEITDPVTGEVLPA